jgi:hypothetical protein
MILPATVAVTEVVTRGDVLGDVLCELPVQLAVTATAATVMMRTDCSIRITTPNFIGRFEMRQGRIALFAVWRPTRHLHIDAPQVGPIAEVARDLVFMTGRWGTG